MLMSLFSFLPSSSTRGISLIVVRVPRDSTTDHVEGWNEKQYATKATTLPELTPDKSIEGKTVVANLVCVYRLCMPIDNANDGDDGGVGNEVGVAPATDQRRLEFQVSFRVTMRPWF